MTFVRFSSIIISSSKRYTPIVSYHLKRNYNFIRRSEYAFIRTILKGDTNEEKVGSPFFCVNRRLGVDVNKKDSPIKERSLPHQGAMWFLLSLDKVVPG